ncbi:MAG TPA: hypothetical protein DCE41_33770 [Cytophagales bacterium]|nr:hypothetical protein [Cytophagales bacterium]HAA21281.1 hypothetical protein [Cytophagales bacterium]HAP59408.1 hypothetical protein [Cytophagales bacterium]
MPTQSRFPLPEYLAHEVVFSSDQLEMVYLPHLSGMMMNHLGEATHDEYRTAFLTMISLLHDYHWKVTISNETQLIRYPVQTRLWFGTRFAFMPGGKKIIEMNSEVVTISSQSGIARSMAKLMHLVIHELSGLDVNTFTNQTEAYAYLANKYAPIEAKAKYPTVGQTIHKPS